MSVSVPLVVFGLICSQLIAGVIGRAMAACNPLNFVFCSYKMVGLGGKVSCVWI